MFAVIYRGYVNAGMELKYQKLWHKIATYFVEERGALGSHLHKTEEGYWLAYSRWPDKATRDASDIFNQSIKGCSIFVFFLVPY